MTSTSKRDFRLGYALLERTLPGTEPLTEHLADGIHRIPLALPLDDLKVINAYAFESSHCLVLVDPGWATSETERTLTAALTELGYTVHDVTKIIATHAHWDQYTQAVGLRDEHGTKVYLGAGERHSLDAFATLTGPYPRQVELLRQAAHPSSPNTSTHCRIKNTRSVSPWVSRTRGCTTVTSSTSAIAP